MRDNFKLRFHIHAALIAFAFLLFATVVDSKAAGRFSVFGTKVGSTYNYAVVPPQGVGIVEFIEAYTPSSTANISLLTAGDGITITSALNAGSSNIVCTPDNLTPGKHVVIYDVSSGATQVGTVLYTNATGCVVTNAPGGAALATSFDIVAGDKLFLMTTNYNLPFAATTTKTLTAGSGGGLFVTPTANRPLLLQVFNSGTNSELIVTGRYE